MPKRRTYVLGMMKQKINLIASFGSSESKSVGYLSIQPYREGQNMGVSKVKIPFGLNFERETWNEFTNNALKLYWECNFCDSSKKEVSTGCLHGDFPSIKFFRLFYCLLLKHNIWMQLYVDISGLNSQQSHFFSKQTSRDNISLQLQRSIEIPVQHLS